MAIGRIRLLMSLVLIFGIGDAALATDTSDRIEIPINQITASNGEMHYSIPVQVGDKVIDVLLDTGSTGFRVGAGAIPPSSYIATDRRTTYGYASGDRLVGVIAHANIKIGGGNSSVDVPFHLVRTLECFKDAPNCPSSRMSQQELNMGLISSDGIRAIIGASMPSHGLATDIPNPLVKFGDAWIVLLPLPGASAPGKLIVNPSDEERSGFTLFPAGQGTDIGAGRDNPIQGCLINNSNQRQFCGPIILDSGKSAVTVITDVFPQNAYWPLGANGTLAFGSEDGQHISMQFKVSANVLPTRVVLGRFPQFGQPPQRVLAGVLPYLKFAVLYDYKSRVIGLKAR